MMDFLTSGTFLVILEILVIASLAGTLIWRIKKNKQASEKRLEQEKAERDRHLTKLLANDLTGSLSGKGSGSRLVIVIRDGEHRRQESFAAGAPVRIGRSKDNELVLRSQYIARHQCILLWQNSRLVLQQAGATNRIRINRGGRVMEHPGETERLQEGDILSIADVSLEIGFTEKG